MNLNAEIIKGGCSCGSVRYEAAGTPDKIAYCHCNSCRKATGAPVAVCVMFVSEQFRITRGTPSQYESSPDIYRGFCSNCGSPLSWTGLWHGKQYVYVHIGSVDCPNDIVPDRHAFCDHRLSWFDSADRLPRFTGTSPLGPLPA